MTTVLFVHGTGVREPDYSISFARVRDELRKRRADLAVAPCPWGEFVGYKLNAHGLSIPGYHATGGLLGPADEQAVPGSDPAVALWGLLYQDPLAELRLLALQAQPPADDLSGWQAPAGGMLLERLQALSAASVTPELRDRLDAGGIGQVFDAALDQLKQEPEVQRALLALPGDALEAHRAALARAIVAQALVLASRQGGYPELYINAPLRDAIVQQLTDELAPAGGTLGLFDPIAEKGVEIAAQLLTSQLRQRRGWITDRILTFVGDILLYQGHGVAIRDFIQAQIAQAAPPVVVLAHSLGGIACVDLLLEHDLRDRVPLLITVGSQAPVLYEIGALQHLPYQPGGTLPAQLPAWINIYDLQDFFSFTGAGLFPQRVRDVQVDNGQPFPHAHGAYWTNPAVWDVVLDAIAV
jgi:hypothetical protein